MVKTGRVCLVGCLLPLCLGAQWEEGALRRGYAAYLRGDLNQAIEAYKQALQASYDPGRVAFDLGSVYAQAKRYYEAALSFTQSLEDARGLRRVKSAYGLATALTEIATSQRGRRAVSTLRQALLHYDLAQCSLTELTSEELAVVGTLPGDIQHNRQVAEALLTRKQQEPLDPQDEEQISDTEVPSLSEVLSGNQPRSASPSRESGVKDQESTGTGNSASTPGRGNLPPLPDTETLTSISSEEALRRLEELKKRLKKPLHSTPYIPGSQDW